MSPTDDHGVHTHDFRAGLHRCVCGASDIPDEVEDPYGPGIGVSVVGYRSNGDDPIIQIDPDDGVNVIVMVGEEQVWPRATSR